MVRYSNRESKLLKAKEMDEASTSASVGQSDTEKQSHEVTQEGTIKVYPRILCQEGKRHHYFRKSCRTLWL